MIKQDAIISNLSCQSSESCPNGIEHSPSTQGVLRVLLFCLVRRAIYILRIHASPCAPRSCSQIRTTRQPSWRNRRLTRRSRALLAASFLLQKARLFAGRFECFGQPCQKQPSTNTATRCFWKTKSGFPKTGRRRRQPAMPWRRKSFIKASSVSLLPCPRMRDMTSERLALVKTSGMRWSTCRRRKEFNQAA